MQSIKIQIHSIDSDPVELKYLEHFVDCEPIRVKKQINQLIECKPKE